MRQSKLNLLRSEARIRRRAFALKCFYAAWFVVIALRLFYLQTYQHEWLAKRADAQQRYASMIPAVRGLIKGRNGWVLARDVRTASFYAAPYELEFVDETAGRLAPLLGTEPQSLSERLRNAKESRRQFVWLDRQVSEETEKSIRALKLRGVYTIKESKRAYPYAPLARQVIGFVGIDGRGLSGIELTQEDVLKGSPGTAFVTHDATRRALDYYRAEVANIYGADVFLTIDEYLQTKVELLMSDLLTEAKAGHVSAIVLKVQTGEVFSLVEVWHTSGSEGSGEDIWYDRYKSGRNHAVQDDYDLGPFTRIFTQSLKMENSAGPKTGVGGWPLEQPTGLGAFGLGSKIGIELPGESPGRYRQQVAYEARDVEPKIIASLIQLAAAFSVLPNDGVWVQPHLVDRTVSTDGNVIRIVKPDSRRVISESTARRMILGLNKGFAPGRGISIIRDAGAVGVVSRLRIPQRQHPTTVVLGFTSITSPQYAVVLAIDDPYTGEPFVRNATARAFSRVVKAAGGEYEIPPE